MMQLPAGGLPTFRSGQTTISARLMNNLVAAVRRLYNRIESIESSRVRLASPFAWAKLMSYRYETVENPPDPPTEKPVGFMGRIMSAAGTDLYGENVELYVWKYPAEDAMDKCVPLLDGYFGSQNPEEWVPVVHMWRRKSVDVEPPPPPPRPDPGSESDYEFHPPEITFGMPEVPPLIHPPPGGAPRGVRGDDPPTEIEYRDRWFVALTFLGTCPAVPPGVSASTTLAVTTQTAALAVAAFREAAGNGN